MVDNNSDNTCDTVVEIDPNDLIIITDTQNWKPTKGFIVEYASQLGFDVENDPPELMSIAEKYLTIDIPDNMWRAFTKDSLKILYIDKFTNDIHLSSANEDLAKKEYQEKKKELMKNLEKTFKETGKESQFWMNNNLEEEKEKENERLGKEKNNKKGDNNEEINELKKQNLNLRKEIEQLKNKLNEEKNKNQKLTFKLEELTNFLNKDQKDTLSIQNEMSEKITAMNNYYNKKLEKLQSIFPFKVSEDDKIMATIFKRSDQNSYISMICKSTEMFIELEKRLFIKYPEYKETKNYYYANGHKIDINKTLEDNKIKDNEIIIISN